jgi:hypothetical protein
VGLGWFVVRVGVVLFFVGSLCYSGQNFIKNWVQFPRKLLYVLLFAHNFTCST